MKKKYKNKRKSSRKMKIVGVVKDDDDEFFVPGKGILTRKQIDKLNS